MMTTTQLNTPPPHVAQLKKAKAPPITILSSSNLADNNLLITFQ